MQEKRAAEEKQMQTNQTCNSEGSDQKRTLVPAARLRREKKKKGKPYRTGRED